MGEIPITFLFLFFFKNAPSPYEHVGHVAVLVTKHFAAFFFEAYSQFNRSWNANSFAPTSSEWCWFSGLSYIWNYVKSLRTFGRRCPHSCYANDPVDNSSLAGGREIREGERERQRGNRERSEAHCWWVLFVVCVTTVNIAWQTGSKISGHPKTRDSVVILPPEDDPLARFRGEFWRFPTR